MWVFGERLIPKLLDHYLPLTLDMLQLLNLIPKETLTFVASLDNIGSMMQCGISVDAKSSLDIQGYFILSTSQSSSWRMKRSRDCFTISSLYKRHLQELCTHLHKPSQRKQQNNNRNLCLDASLLVPST